MNWYLFVLDIITYYPEELEKTDTTYAPITMSNKAIRDGKYLARHMPVLGNVHPIKFENIDIFS